MLRLNDYEVLVGFRYFREKKQSFLLSLVSLIPALCIGIGVAALVVVLSVMNGFQKEIRNKLIEQMAHLEISEASGSLADWHTLKQSIKHHAILGMAPYVEGQSLFSYGSVMQGAMIRGVLPEDELTVTEVGRQLIAGQWHDLKAGDFSVVIGSGTAYSMGIGVGDKLSVMTPEGNVTAMGALPRVKQFTVVGIFETGSYPVDNSMAFIHLQDAQALWRKGDDVTGLRLKLTDPFAAPIVKSQIELSLPVNQTYWLSDWTDKNRDYFNAVNMEKTMLFLILTMIIFVAACNLISTLLMSIIQKKSDIAILQTLGASRRSIAKIFFIQGSVSCLIGSLLGLGLGLLIVLNLGPILSFARWLTGQALISGAVYGIDSLPYDVQVMDLIWIMSLSLILSLAATLYPSYLATKTQPAKALRYE